MTIEPTRGIQRSHSRRFDIRSIARGGGGRYDEEHHVLGRTIAEAMFNGRRNVNTLPGIEGDRVAREFERRGAGEHIEELSRVRMEMPHFAGTRRYALLDDAEIHTLQQMPTVANGSPRVVLSARPINRHQSGGYCRFLLEWRHRVIRGRGAFAERPLAAKRNRASNEVISKRLPSVLVQARGHYSIVYKEVEDEIVAAADYWIAHCLAWGKTRYIDDLISLPGRRRQRQDGALIDWLIEQSPQEGCDEVHLDTGFMRHGAHRLYLNKGLEFSCHHLSTKSSVRRAFAAASTRAPGHRPGGAAP
jgi:hypothetical protein